MIKKAIATRPGRSTKHAQLSPEEQAQVDRDAASTAEEHAAQAAIAYRIERRVAYTTEMGDIPGDTDPISTMGSQFDFLYGFLETQRQTNGPLKAAIDADPDLTRVLDKRLEIKARYPKPPA